MPIKTKPPIAYKNCRFCGKKFDPDEKKPKNGFWEPVYCDKICRRRFQSWKYLEGKRAK